MNEQLKRRILDACSGTLTGAILTCAMDEADSPVGPRFTSKAICTSDGFLQANFVGSDGRSHLHALVGSYAELEQNIVLLNEHLGLDEDEKRQLWELVDSWIAVDYR